MISFKIRFLRAGQTCEEIYTDEADATARVESLKKNALVTTIAFFRQVSTETKVSDWMRQVS